MIILAGLIGFGILAAHNPVGAGQVLYHGGMLVGQAVNAATRFVGSMQGNQDNAANTVPGTATAPDSALKATGLTAILGADGGGNLISQIMAGAAGEKAASSTKKAKS